MKKLKIAIYTQTFPPKGGGVSTSHYNLYNILKDDYDVEVYAFNETLNLEEDSVKKYKTITWINQLVMRFLKLKFQAKKHQSKLSNVNAIISSMIPVLKLNKPLKKFQPDIILVPDFNLPAYLLSKPKSSKLVCFAHHNYGRFKNHILLENQDWLDFDIASSMEQKAMKKIDAVISPSQYMINRYQNTTYQGKHVFRIPNFMESRVFERIAEESKAKCIFPEGKRVIYIPSAGSVVKGKRYVFEIIRRLLATDTEVFFYLSGQIPNDLAYELENYKAHIYAPGHVNWEDNVKYMMQCYLGITPNLEENFSNAILEAQAAGMPFVAFDTGGNKEIIINEETGFIVPYLDVEALIKKSIILLKDSKLQNRFKDASKKLCAKRFNNELIKEEYKKVFQQLTQL